MTDLATLNRLRVNAGKPELKSWKASRAKLESAIQGLRDQGFLDTLPGANVDATPITDDPEIAKNLTPPEPKTEEAPKAKEPTKAKAGLARGLDTDGYAKHSRKAIQDIREKERKVEKAARKEAKNNTEVEDKAERQKKHIEEKRAKRAAEGKLKPEKVKNDNEITVVEIAAELGIDPRVARAKLRRHEAKIEKLHTKGQDRWTFPKSAAPTIRGILKGDKE